LHTNDQAAGLFILLCQENVYEQTAVHCAKILEYLDRTIIAPWYLWDHISLWRKEFVLMDKGAQILHCQ